MKYINAYFSLLSLTTLSCMLQAVDHNGENRNWSKILFYSCQLRDLNGVKSSIENGATIDVKDMNGFTSLHVATNKNCPDIIQFLIKRGADKEARVKFIGWTPLHIACLKASFDLVKLLVTLGANKDARDKAKMTPLHYASGKGCLDIIKYLIKKGADKNAKDLNGCTLLHVASNCGQLDVVKYLVEKQRADINTKSNKGSTPLDAALKRTSENHKVIKYLKQHGAVKGVEHS